MDWAEKWFYVYIMTNRSRTLYTGITGEFRLRVFQHKTGVFEGFTSRYKMDRLVYWGEVQEGEERHHPRKTIERLDEDQKDPVDCKYEPDLAGPSGRLVSGVEGEKERFIDPSTSRSRVPVLRSG